MQIPSFHRDLSVTVAQFVSGMIRTTKDSLGAAKGLVVMPCRLKKSLPQSSVWYVDEKAFLIPVQNLAALDQLFNHGNLMISGALDYFMLAEVLFQNAGILEKRGVFD